MSPSSFVKIGNCKVRPCDQGSNHNSFIFVCKFLIVIVISSLYPKKNKSKFCLMLTNEVFSLSLLVKYILRNKINNRTGCISTGIYEVSVSSI